MGKMTYSFSQAFSPITPMIIKSAHVQSVHGGWDSGYAWVQQYGISIARADLATTVSECPTCSQQRLMLSPYYSIISKEPVGYMVSE